MEKKVSITIKTFDELLSHGFYKESFYDSGWCLFYLLNNVGQDPYTYSSNHSRIFWKEHQRVSRKIIGIQQCDMLIDETLANSSNSLHSTIYEYLWGSEGKNVYIHPKDNSIDFTEAMENDFKIKRAITEDRDFNSSIRISLKNCIDYGAGYVFTDHGFYRPIHPLTIQKCIHGKEVCYIYEQTQNKSFLHNDYNDNYVHSSIPANRKHDGKKDYKRHVYIFGSAGKFSEMLGLPITEEYFMLKCEIASNNDVLVSKLKTSKYQFIHDITLPFYEDEPGMAIGCGMKALGAALSLIKIATIAKDSQEMEMAPPALISSVITLMSHKGLLPGSSNVYNEYALGDLPPVMYPTPARAANSMAYMEIWRNKIRECYILGAVGNTGRGQTTALEASTNYSNVDSMLKSMVRPFDWFIMPLIKRFIYNNKKQLRKETDYDYMNTRILLLGGPRSADVFSKVSVMLQEIQGVAAVTGQLDPSITAIFNAGNMVYGMLSDELPVWFLATPEQYQEAVMQMQAQMQAQQGAQQQ